MFAAIQGSAAGWSKPYVVWSFIIGGVLLVAFVAVEARARTDLELSLFRTTAGFAVTSLVTVFGMFGFLSAGYSTWIWIGAVQRQDPMKVALAFLFLRGLPFFLIPAVSKALRSVNPTMTLRRWLTLMGVGSLLCLRLVARDPSIANFILPDVLIGIGFALSVASFRRSPSTPRRSTWRAWPARRGHAARPRLRARSGHRRRGRRVGRCEQDARRPRADRRPHAGWPGQPAMGLAHGGGPLAVASALPAGTPAQLVAVDALGSGFHLAWLIAAAACLIAALITVIGLRGIKHAAEPTRNRWPTRCTPSWPDASRRLLVVTA